MDMNDTITETKEKVIESINAEAFVNDLMHFIFDYGPGTYSKTDAYNYLVYFANKHSADAFSIQTAILILPFFLRFQKQKFETRGKI